MNILMIGEYPPKIGGISTHISQLKKELNNLDQDVFVLSYSDSLEEKVYSTKLPKKFRGIFFIIFGFFKGINIIRTNNIDLIHAHFATTSGLLGYLLSIFTRKKRILTVHGSDINVHLKKKILGKFVKFVLSKYQVIIAVSPDLVEKIRNLIKGEVVFVPNGVDHIRFYPEKHEKKGVGFIGALVNEKNPKDFLKLVSLLRAKGIVEPAFIIGDGYLKKELLESSQGLDIIFLGEVVETERYLNKFLCVVSTSKTEGFGISILESMASGTPVASLSSPGSDYLLSDLGLTAQDTNELEKLVENILINPEFRNNLSNKVLERSNLFSWENTAIKTLEVYKKISFK
ncbi:MAG: D-inositol-3-phosphate glycosyltransferase [Candidatus Methanofastidiosum methylothiophilum]|uniref:D-inositol-3-phosphate glycosyltransferase n=1 Tax=Candidatus Methanofastidiosum methylothiophilum TaxID=1705564 RepID=A0A150J1K9_9EURY|nr:MAG: D-inositol-3-phosphate glycosyltransferase [Candidatus Methanofastidiosum methylthiophilus]KYC48672.1 MAG: D-inositol-3-phosphate glycosyltransferase [Candidatus Methanofastidiosum methylthiophilus]KYC51123.1 MAG: D-inositol-3-phosphate glycosyltransferase [Candidatus Methanofastidiosum methylthiophilus]